MVQCHTPFMLQLKLRKLQISFYENTYVCNFVKILYFDPDL